MSVRCEGWIRPNSYGLVEVLVSINNEEKEGHKVINNGHGWREKAVRNSGWQTHVKESNKSVYKGEENIGWAFDEVRQAWQGLVLSVKNIG